MSHDPSSLLPWSALYDDPADARLDALREKLSALDTEVDERGTWPDALWRELVADGVTRWSIPAEFGGDAVERVPLLHRYARVAQGSLTAAFILSQHDAGVRRLAGAADRLVAREWLAKVAAGQAFTTVGISQLTTSRRSGPQALVAVETPGGFRLDGVMPWVTAASQADVFVSGAALADGRQILVALTADRPGVSVHESFPLAALQASCTAEVSCEGVEVGTDDVLAGPVNDVIAHSSASGTGGLETSALALGLARAALEAIEAQAPRRADLTEPVEALADAWKYTWADLMAAATGEPGAPTAGHVRGRANALVSRTTQAYLTARKGSGFLRTEPAQRWAREALFFLVWSCPSPVAEATIRDLAGLCSP